MYTHIISHTPGREDNVDWDDVRNHPYFYKKLRDDCRIKMQQTDVENPWHQIYKELAQRFAQKAAFRRVLVNRYVKKQVSLNNF